MYKLVVEQRYSESIKLCVDALKEIHKEEICLAVNSIPERNVVINLAYQIGRCRNVPFILSGELKKDFSIIGLETDLWNNTHKKEEEKDKKKWESVDVQPDFLFHANMVEKKEQIMIMEVKTCKVLDEKPFDWDLGKLCMYVYKEETQYCEAVYLIFGQKESKINNLLKGFCSSYGMMLDSVWQNIRFILVSIDENDRLKPEVYKLIKCQQKLI